MAKKTGNNARPRSYAAFKKEVEKRGYKVRVGSHNHVLRPNGTFLMTYSGTSSDHRGALNTWNTFLKAINADRSNAA